MINIIGAGPAGLHLGYLLAKKNYKVKIYEQNNQIGYPEHCTGIVTSDLKKIIEIPNSIIQNQINKVDLIGYNKKARLNLKQSNLILNRQKFDIFLAEKARKAGAIIKLGRKIETFNLKGVYIGADGWNSSTAKQFHLYKNKELLTGIQVNADYKNKNIVSFYLRKNSIQWIVPVNKTTAKIGIAKKYCKKQDLDQFLKQLNIEKIHKYYGSFIPIFSPKGKRSNNNKYLIGDAGGFVKATTGGGIIQALISAECCFTAITENRNYEMLWKKKLFFNLLMHKKIHSILKKMTPNEIDDIIVSLNKDKVLENYSRDNINKWFFKILISHPNYLYFLKYLF